MITACFPPGMVLKPFNGPVSKRACLDHNNFGGKLLWEKKRLFSVLRSVQNISRRRPSPKVLLYKPPPKRFWCWRIARHGLRPREIYPKFGAFHPDGAENVFVRWHKVSRIPSGAPEKFGGSFLGPLWPEPLIRTSPLGRNLGQTAETFFPKGAPQGFPRNQFLPL